MGTKKRWIFGAVVVAVALSAFLKTRGALSEQVPSPPALRYQTRCEVLGSSFVDGYVSNLSQDTYEVRGVVLFNFSSANSMSQRHLSTAVVGLKIPAGETIRIAHAPQVFQLNPGEVCAFDVGAAIRKL